MQKEIIELPPIMLVGMKIRTNNKNECNPATAKIGLVVQSYFSHQTASTILSRKHPGVTLIAYFDYESDYRGDYTMCIGEDVTSTDTPQEGLASLSIPKHTYVKFTTDTGKIPEVIIKAWQEIWQMSEAELGGKRSYIADFERYDTRAKDPMQAVVEIYIGIDK